VAALAVVALLLVAGVFWVINSAETSAPPPPTETTAASSTTTPRPTTTTRTSRTTTSSSAANGVSVNPVDYVGRPASVAAAALQDVGLEAEIGTVLGGEPNDPSRCRVLYLSPTGDVPRGETVSVTCQEF
jgi:serine/threonine-protein kinase